MFGARHGSLSGRPGDAAVSTGTAAPTAQSRAVSEAADTQTTAAAAGAAAAADQNLPDSRLRRVGRSPRTGGGSGSSRPLGGRELERARPAPRPNKICAQ